MSETMGCWNIVPILLAQPFSKYQLLLTCPAGSLYFVFFISANLEMSVDQRRKGKIIGLGRKVQFSEVAMQGNSPEGIFDGSTVKT